MQSSDPVKRQEIRQMSKKNAENAHIFAKQLIYDILSYDDDKLNLENKLSYMVKDTVMTTACELTGEKSLEK